ncbi:Complex I intermediate-associated [Hyphodiscus hymeniophilus]|uniref:Complex I intermediate-associated n=1 Tax=Hyphodiscus hymeniophilus TaxID=353542 RepID=A0A9P6VLQ5_9HELO|nr:Complex I intermediate-associated [Hyphodiscus hymeniophilus]
MRVTPNLLSKGFFGRSLDEFKRLSNIALKAEGTRSATTPYILTTFHDPSSPQTCKLMSDANVGGFSRASLDFIPPNPSSPPSPTSNPAGHIRFHGSISIELPANKPQVQRTGYAAFRTHDRPPTVFGKSLWDIDPYAFLALRIKSDGRKYFVNVQTESIVPTDLHQHRLYARRPGEWETVLIKWNEFVRTNHGVVIEPQTELLRQKVRTVGVGLIDRVPGPFELCVERIWACNGLSQEEIEEDGRAEEGLLKSRHGERIRWGEEKGQDGV